MSERIDHVAEAMKQLSDAEAYSNDAHSLRYGGGHRDRIQAAFDHGTLAAMRAQAEATLALVEQQRIANLIALATEFGFTGQVLVTVEKGLRPDIARALGVEQ